MQNAIAPVAPTTPTPPVESKPSPRAPASHAFATLLKQSQNAPPAPAKAAPVAPAKADGGVDGNVTSTTTRAATKAVLTADARRAEDARSDAGRVEARSTDRHTDDSDAATPREGKDNASSTGDGTTTGTGVPPTHGLVAQHRLAAAPPESASADKAGRATVASAMNVAERADSDAATTSATSFGGGLAPHGPAVDAREDDPPSRAHPGTGTADKIAFASAETPPGRTTPFAPSALRTEAATRAAPAPASEATRAGPTASVDATVTTPVASPDFTQAFAVQVSVLVQDGVQRAELHLNPVEMGPVSVHIVVDGTQARIDFGADALATRQAIEAGLPELASALRDAGMTLQGGGVSQHARDPNAESRSGDAPAGRLMPGRDDELRAAPALRRHTVAAGGVDLYA